MNQSPSLIVLPALRGWSRADGTIVVTRKFISGMEAYAARWPGRVSAILEPAPASSDNLDHVAVHPGELPFDLEVLSFDSEACRARLSRAEVVLGGADWRQNAIPAWCQEAGVPCVWCTEYSLQTRWQIARAEVANPLRRWRRYLWEWGQERVNRRNIGLCDGLQANGTPTFEAYRGLSRRPLLYFDTRTTRDMLVDEVSLNRRLAGLASGRPLRLAFSGRLIAMKGADHLIPVARELRRLNVPFSLSILGDGALRPGMLEQLDRVGLNGLVELPGTWDFATRLVPYLRDEVDLFVCPHRQGDPSCTYLETLACGVPILGYANEAWSGLLRRGAFGWQVALDDPRALARSIGERHHHRESLITASRAARQFAEGHTCESEFSARVEHLLTCRDARRGISTPQAELCSV